MAEESDSEFLKDTNGEKAKKPEKKKEKEYEIKFRVTPRAVERLISVTIILVLLYFVFHFAFQEKLCTEVATIAPTELITASAVVENKTPVVEKTITKETTTAPKENKTTEPTTPKKKVVDAEILLDKNDIETEGDYPSIKVEEVVYQIKNKGDTFRAKVELKWYDKDDHTKTKENIRATDTHLVAEKQTITRTLTEFIPTHLNSANDDEIFIIYLYNNADDKLLDTARVTFSP